MSHDHRHDHAHGPADPGRAFAVGVALNMAFVIVEVVTGIVSGSIALVADAGHNLSDVLGLALAWGAARLAKRKPSRRRTYGLRRTTILASLANAILLLVAVGALGLEAIQRFSEETHPRGGVVVVTAAVGVAVNAGSALLFMRARKSDANVRGAFLHLVADAAVSAGVVIAGVIILVTGWHWVDPAASLLVSAAIAVGTWSLLRDALNLVLDAVPEGIDPEEVNAYLAALPNVCAVHDLHIWAMSTTENALTAHLVVTDTFPVAVLRSTEHALEARFKIHHVTLQVEPTDAPGECKRAQADVL